MEKKNKHKSENNSVEIRWLKKPHYWKKSKKTTLRNTKYRKNSRKKTAKYKKITEWSTQRERSIFLTTGKFKNKSYRKIMN